MLCPDCAEIASDLVNNRKLRFRTDQRDTTNSRYSILKAAVKRIRFGNPNASHDLMLQILGPKKQLDLDLNQWL